MTQQGFFFDCGRCTGCKTCVLACKDYKKLGPETQYRKVYDYEGGSWTQQADGAWNSDAFVYHVSVACNHCDDPVCVMVCPTGAMHREQDKGLVVVDDKVCIGCGYCVLSCPYNAPKVDREKGYSVKCDGCVALVKAGEKPVCVAACPVRALDFGPVEDMQARGERANIAPLPVQSYTKPNLFIKAGDDARSASSTSGVLANPMEVL
jgi:anaerobic dimethyl sulfoxide reductase subunit B (iron-sulfur subunit)